MSFRSFLLLVLPVFLLNSAFGNESQKPVIVFDYGGVLATAHKEPFYAFVAKEFSVKPQEVQGLLKEMRKVRKEIQNDALAWEKIAKERGISLPKNWNRLCEEKLLSCVRERPQMMDLVRSLKQQGYQVAMLSNISRREARLVKKLGYYLPFHPVVLSCEIGVSKPKLQAFRILLKQVKKKGKEVIFIDDREQNIKAASKLGIDGIQFISYDQLIEAFNKRKIRVGLTK